MTRVLCHLFAFTLCMSLTACGGGTSPIPTQPTPIPEPTPEPQPPKLVSLTGIVRSKAGNPISGATVKILDGLNAGKTINTSTGGVYRFEDLAPSNGNLEASAVGYNESRTGIYIDGTNTLDFTLEPANYAGTWVGSGTGVASDGSPVTVQIELSIVGSEIETSVIGYHFRDSTHPSPNVPRDQCRRFSPFTDRQKLPTIENSFERYRNQNNVFQYTPTVFRGTFASSTRVNGVVTLIRQNGNPFVVQGCPESATVEWTGMKR